MSQEIKNTQFESVEKLVKERLAPSSSSKKRFLPKVSIEEWFSDYWSQGYDRPELYDTTLSREYAALLTQMEKEEKNIAILAPRGYLKSHLLGFGYLTYKAYTSENPIDFLYFCYSADAAGRRVREMKQKWSLNAKLASYLDQPIDLSNYKFNHTMHGKLINLYYNGLKTFTRGEHVNGAIFCDDVLKDPDNKLSTKEVEKVTDIFFADIDNLKRKDLYVPTVLFGTPMQIGDLFDVIREKHQDMYVFKKFQVANMYPIPDYAYDDGSLQVLCEEIQSRKLVFKNRTNPKFAQEMMCEYSSALDAYFTKEEILAIEDPTLRSLNVDDKYEKEDNEIVVAGADIGRKKHPTHISVFSVKGNNVKQIFQQFYYETPYDEQVSIMNKIAENFQLDYAKWDNTRTELHDRGIVSPWTPVQFTKRNKEAMATAFDFYVNSKHRDGQFSIRLIRNSDQHSQIISVTTELDSMSDNKGHGDAFFSSAMALWCLYEHHTNIELIGTFGETDEKHHRRRIVARIEELRHQEGNAAKVEQMNELIEYMKVEGYGDINENDDMSEFILPF